MDFTADFVWTCNKPLYSLQEYNFHLQLWFVSFVNLNCSNHATTVNCIWIDSMIDLPPSVQLWEVSAPPSNLITFRLVTLFEIDLHNYNVG